jgi:hypothetical protein
LNADNRNGLRGMNRSPLLRYAVAAGSVILGWLARESLTPGVGQTALPFIFFFPAAALAAWFGGFGPGLVSTILGAAAADWFFIEPVHSWSVGKFGDVIALASFLISSLLIVAAIEAMHRARARALLELTERERLEAEVARLKETFATTIGGIRGVRAPSQGPSGGRLATMEAGSAKRGTPFVSSGFPAAAVRWSAVLLAVYAPGWRRRNADRVVRWRATSHRLGGQRHLDVSQRCSRGALFRRGIDPVNSESAMVFTTQRSFRVGRSASR